MISVKTLDRNGKQVMVGDTVIVDYDEGIRFIITAILIRSANIQLELSWTHNGDLKSSWVDIFRISRV